MAFSNPGVAEAQVSLRRSISRTLRKERLMKCCDWPSGALRVLLLNHVQRWNSPAVPLQEISEVVTILA